MSMAKKQETKIENSLEIMEVVETALNKQKAESNFCFTIYIIALCLWILLVKLWDYLGQPIEAKNLTTGVEIIAALMMAVTLIFTHFHVKDMGLNFKKIGWTMLRAGIISVVIVLIMMGISWIKAGTILPDWSKFSFHYMLTSVLQEFLARGFLLTCLLNIYTMKQGKHIAIITSSLLFMALHLYYGLFFMIGAAMGKETIGGLGWNQKGNACVPGLDFPEVCASGIGQGRGVG